MSGERCVCAAGGFVGRCSAPRPPRRPPDCLTWVQSHLSVAASWLQGKGTTGAPGCVCLQLHSAHNQALSRRPYVCGWVVAWLLLGPVNSTGLHSGSLVTAAGTSLRPQICSRDLHRSQRSTHHSATQQPSGTPPLPCPTHCLQVVQPAALAVTVLSGRLAGLCTCPPDMEEPFPDGGVSRSR
jgi:hypothetical protein